MKDSRESRLKEKMKEMGQTPIRVTMKDSRESRLKERAGKTNLRKEEALQ